MTAEAPGDDDPAASRSPEPSTLWRWSAPALALVVAAALGLASYLVSRDGSPGPAPSHSSTIALGDGGDTLWVTSPDDDAVVELETSTLEVRRAVRVGGRPLELTRHGDRLLVTRAQGDDLVVLDTSGPEISVATVALPCGGSHSVVVAGAAAGGWPGDTALVTCPTDELVALVDLDRLTLSAELAVPGRPTGLVSDGETLTVSSAATGVLTSWPLADLAAAVAQDPGDTSEPGAAGRPLIDVVGEVTEAWADGDRSASTLGPLALLPDGPVASYQVVDNLREPTAEELAAGAGSYGVPLEGRARIEPAVAGACGGARFADFRAPTRVLSGPVALAAAPGSDLLWVVGQFSHTVAVIRCDGGPAAGLSEIVAMFRVGDGARGIAVDPGGRRAWVDVGFDHAVAELALPEAERTRSGDAALEPVTTEASGETAASPVGAPIDVLDPVTVERRETGPRYLTPLAEEGRRMFADATDTHLTPQGVVSCASCHPSGGEDGLTWRIETAVIDQKLRRTPPVWALDDEAKPLHWDGSLATAEDLIGETVRELLGGDGLLVDPAPMAAYMAELEPPPPAPVRGPADSRAVARGRTLFHSDEAACASCHLLPSGTDGRAHPVLPAGSDPASRLPEVVTPPLLGVRGRAPLGHDGSILSLPELLMDIGRAHGGASRLTDAQRDDLLAFLRTL